jgi:hypothetical protein
MATTAAVSALRLQDARKDISVGTRWGREFNGAKDGARLEPDIN